MNQRIIKNINNTDKNLHDPNISGLCLIGTVVHRVRRMVPKNNPTTQIVTYTIQDSASRKFYVDDYAPDDYYEIGEFVTLQIYIKTYIRKNGESSFTLNVQKDDNSKGEPF